MKTDQSGNKRLKYARANEQRNAGVNKKRRERDREEVER